MQIEQVMAGIYDQYDVIADELLLKEEPNRAYGLASSNAQMAGYVMRTLGVSKVDVLGEHHFDEVIKTADVDKIVACSFVALLRYQTFTVAKERAVGIEGITKKGQAYAELWYLRLKDRLDELANPKAVIGRWVH